MTMILGLTIRPVPFEPFPEMWRVSSNTVFLTCDEIIEVSGIKKNYTLLRKIEQWRESYEERRREAARDNDRRICHPRTRNPTGAA